jgi:hypothetical protein
MTRSGKDWLIASLIRAARTMAQTALSMLTVGMAMSDIDWLKLISISAVSGIFSILTSVATGLPEVTTEGQITVNTEADSESALLGLSLDGQVTPERIQKIKDKGLITFKVV